jgi:hypothetical protein
VKLLTIYHYVEIAVPSMEFSEGDITLIPVFTILRKGVAIAPRSTNEGKVFLAGCGKSGFSCHPERSEGSAFSQLPGKKQIPRANPALGMTVLEFFRSLLEPMALQQ